ncbi:MAG TPA: cellulase family glycosylhydrolase, partial [Gemmataceae bacterium]|nr:cellulase family glycosylhydrolase [Gemmataceae bacterium]
MRGAACLAATLLAAGLSVGPLAPRGLAGGETKSVTRLGTDGTRFTVNDKPAFLFGVSYYGALGAKDEAVRQDLRELKKHGFNWVRVWATWAAFGEDVSAVDGEGKPREPFLKRLERLVAACDEQGVVVDVTLSRGNGSTGPARLQALEAHRRAVETLVTALKAHRNWYLDLANERNIKDKRYASFADLKELRELVRKLDPNRLVTASHAGDLSRDDLTEYLRTVRVDFLSPHRPRTADSAGQTESRSKEYLTRMKELGREVPLHYQEPFRRDFGKWQPRAEDYVTDLKGALAGGAAGWCWHNGDSRAAKDGQPRRSFDLREKRLFEQLDEEEGRALPLLSRVIAGAAKDAGAKSPAAGDKGGEKRATPAEQYQAIRKDYEAAAGGGDGSDEGRRKRIAELDKLRPALGQRYLDLAERHPSDPVAVDALTQAIWVVNNNAFPAGGKDSPGARAMALLLRDYLRSDKLGPICLRINAGFRQEHETFLRTLLE